MPGLLDGGQGGQHRRPPGSHMVRIGAIVMHGIPLDELPADIYSLEPMREVDLPFQSYWNKQTNRNRVAARLNGEQGHYFGRRTLEVAYYEALAGKEEYIGPVIEDWRRVSKKAGSLSKALTAFLEVVAYDKNVEAWQKMEPDKPIPDALLTAPLRSILSRNFYQHVVAGKLIDLTKIAADSEYFAKGLIATRRFSEVAKTSAAAHAKILSSKRTNEGLPELRAFAKPFVEAYIFLYAERPPQGNIEFASLVSAAWSDVCQDEFDFVRQIRLAIEGVDEGRLQWLSYSGPEWLI